MFNQSLNKIQLLWGCPEKYQKGKIICMMNFLERDPTRYPQGTQKRARIGQNRPKL